MVEFGACFFVSMIWSTHPPDPTRLDPAITMPSGTQVNTTVRIIAINKKCWTSDENRVRYGTGKQKNEYQVP